MQNPAEHSFNLVANARAFEISETLPLVKMLMLETCQLCGRIGHETKSMRDQCRLFTAILGRGWGVSRHLGEEESMSDTEEEEEMFITPDTSFSEE